MKRTSLITTTALLASLAAAPALAVDVNAGGNASTDVEVQAGSDGANAGTGVNTDAQIGAGTTASDGSAAATTDSGITASTSSDANFGLLMSSLNGNVDTAAEIQAMTDVSNVNVVKVSDLAQGNNQVAVNNAISKNAEATTELQTAIEANSALKAELDQQSVDVSSIVAADVGADGQLTVFVQ